MKLEPKSADPEIEFRDPQELLASSALTNGQKVRLLENWREDLLSLQRATEENMAGAEGSAGVAERLKQVTDALEDLGAGTSDDAHR